MTAQLDDSFWRVWTWHKSMVLTKSWCAKKLLQKGLFRGKIYCTVQYKQLSRSLTNSFPSLNSFHRSTCDQWSFPRAPRCASSRVAILTGSVATRWRWMCKLGKNSPLPPLWLKKYRDPYKFTSFFWWNMMKLCLMTLKTLGSIVTIFWYFHEWMTWKWINRMKDLVKYMGLMKICPWFHRLWSWGVGRCGFGLQCGCRYSGRVLGGK